MTVQLDGILEIKNTGFERIRVIHNGVEIYAFESTGTDPNDAWTTVTHSHSVIIDVSEEKPCTGHVIRIEGETGDAVANNNVGWEAQVTIT